MIYSNPNPNPNPKLAFKDLGFNWDAEPDLVAHPEAPQKVKELMQVGQMTFRTLCYFEGWTDFEKFPWELAANDEWSPDNPMLGAWRNIELLTAIASVKAVKLYQEQGLPVESMFGVTDPEDLIDNYEGSLAKSMTEWMRDQFIKACTEDGAD